MVNIYVGDCLESMRGMDSASIHCCVTSPPYFGLRDYGHDGQIGLEPTPDEFVGKLVEVFREVRRVLRDDGTLWLNLGDSYVHSQPGRNRNGTGGQIVRGDMYRSKNNIGDSAVGKKLLDVGLKHKDLIGIPWRVAFALQDDGWWLRQDIIWHKPNPMPESVTDRCTKAHEYIFLMAKSERYYYDAEAVSEVTEKIGGKPRQFGANKQVGTMRQDIGQTFVDNGKRNRRSVWTVATQPFRGAHFATFPDALIMPCILAGCPENGTVLDPFGGAGTTGLVAQRHGRNAVLCELNPEYAQMAFERVKADSPMFSAAEKIYSKKM